MSQSKKKEKTLQHQRALTRARIKALSELKGIPLVSQNEPLCNTTPVIFNIPAAYPKKTAILDVTISGRSFRKRSCSERATLSTEGHCQCLSMQNQSLRQQVLAQRYDNPFFLRMDNISWLDVKTRNRQLRKRVR